MEISIESNNNTVDIDDINIDVYDINNNSDNNPDKYATNIPTDTNSSPNLDNFSWESLEYNNSGIPFGYKGLPFSHYKSLTIQSMASKLNVKGIKNAKKSEMINEIIATHKNKTAYTSCKVFPLLKTIYTPRKEIQCTYWLLNILFSDEFSEQFSCIGNTAC
jgi:hypothetical protein